MATSESDETEVIENEITAMGVFNASDKYQDRVFTAGFDDDGYAKANLYFDDCVSSGQVKTIRESEAWEVESIHPDGDGDGIHLRIREQR